MRIFLIVLCLFPSISFSSSLQFESVDSLLKLIEDGKITESKEHKAREQKFLWAKNQHKTMLKETVNQRVAEEKISSKLESAYDRNEEELTKLKQRLNERLGTMKELFGHLQTTANKSLSTFETSITSAEIKDRSEFINALLQKVSSSDSLPSINEMEKLWYEIQREIVETGRISSFKAPVVDAEGITTERTVMRIGTFNLISDGKYLQYIHETDKLVELSKQPPTHYQKAASNFQSSQDEFVGVGLDPTRGAILSAIVEAPDLGERIEQGGFVGYAILVLGIIGAIIIVERMIYLIVVTHKINKQRKTMAVSKNNPLGRIFMAYESNKKVDLETLELKLGEAILKERAPLERFTTLLKIISVVAPLLGLLGTVTGMINTFQSITLFGTGDPKLMAGGISQALMTTVLGLCVAIPTIFFHSLVNSRYKQILMTLEEQSTGLVAKRAESDLK